MKIYRTFFILLYWLLLSGLGFSVACANTPIPITPALTITFTPLQPLTATPHSISSQTPSPTSSSNIAPTLSPVAVSFITNGNRETSHVALTFDMCQDPSFPASYDAEIVNVLQQYNVPATFFMGGDWMRTHPDETQILAANPLFELGNHSWSHPDLRTMTEDQISEQIVLTQDMLYKLTGRQSHLFRLPSGLSTELVLQVIAQHGLYTIQWDVVTGDPDPNFDAATIQRAVREGIQNGSIIIMHANGRGWNTAEALPSIIEYLQSQDYTLVTVSQLIGLEPIP
jgi:peptidoglycan/xylan/chitin deacetylase (PgdA/CDA1 family)